MKNISLVIVVFVLALPTICPAQDLQLVLNKMDSIQSKLDSIYPKETKEVQFSVGGNLNLVEEGFINGLYYDVNFFLPELWKPGGFDIGLDGRFSQGKLVGKADTSTTITRYFAFPDSVNALRQRYQTVDDEDNTYLLLSLNPTMRLSNGLYFTTYLEYFRQRTDASSAYVITLQDTVPVNSATRFSMLPVENEAIRLDRVFHLFNFGLGLKVFLDLRDVIVNIKPMIGRGSVSYDGRYENRGFFYYTHFEIQEKKRGFKFGGEVRGLFGSDDVSVFNEKFFDPVVNVYIAKTFTFKALGDLVLGK